MFKKIRNTFLDMDKTLFFVSLIMIIFGTLNIVTASSREAVVNLGANVFYYFYRHIAILFMSFIGFIIMLSIPTKKYSKWMPVIYVVIVGLNLYLVIRGLRSKILNIDTSTRGADNWINLGFFKLQPSEIAKPILIVVSSLLFTMHDKLFKNFKVKHTEQLGKILCLCLIIPVLVFFQKDAGTAIILCCIFMSIYIASPISGKEKFKSILILGLIGIISIMFMIRFSGSFLTGAQKSRFDYFNPCSKYEQNGYQICNAYIAINNGGLNGLGMGKSTQKYSYIPEPHTDMVFAIIAEEQGVLKCSLIFLGYIVILLKILNLASRVKKISHKYICIGTATYMFLHIFINLGGLFGIIPLTGVPLPFLSYGGSFTLSFIATLGIIQRIHIETRNEKIKVS